MEFQKYLQISFIFRHFWTKIVKKFQIKFEHTLAPFWKCRHFSPLPGAFRAICLRVCTGPSVSVCAQISHPIGPIPPQGRIEANQLHSRWVNIWSRLDRRRRINRGKSYSSISLPPPASKSMESTFNAIFNAPRHRPLMEHFAGLRVVDLGHCLFSSLGSFLKMARFESHSAPSVWQG